MEERKLSSREALFDETLHLLTADEKKVYETLYTEIKSSLSITETILKDELTNGYCYSILSYIENKTIDLFKLLKYDSNLEKEKESRYTEIRSLNNENRELRRQLGEKVSNEDVREKLKNLSQSIKKWWNQEGFGHTSKISYSEYGNIELKLSGMICENHYDDGDNGKKIDYLIKLGFSVKSEGSGYGWIVDNESNRILLEKLLISKFPSADILSIHSRSDKKGGEYEIRDIEVMIYNLDDIV